MYRDRAECACRRHSPKGDAGDPGSAGRGRNLVDGAWDEAKTLQRSLRDGLLRIVAHGVKEDPAAE